MGDIQPKYTPGEGTTFTALAAVVGGRLVEIPVGQNRRVQPAGAASRRVVGIALRDAAPEAEVPVEHAGVFKMRAVGAIAAGDLVIAAADGRVAALAAPSDPPTQAEVNATRAIIGQAWQAIADGTDGLVQLRIG